MQKPRLIAVLALTLLVVLPLQTTHLHAQSMGAAETEVDRTQRQKAQADGLVDEAVADREVVEADLAETITRLNQIADELTSVSIRAEELAGEVTETQTELRQRNAGARREATEAYMQAVASPSSVFLTTGLEESMVVDETLSGMISESQSEINRVATLKRQLTQLQTEMEEEEARVVGLQQDVESEVGHLEEVYAAADSEVTEAIGAAAEADAAYRAALSDAEQARAREEARRREEERERNELDDPPADDPPTTEPPGEEPPDTEPPDTDPPGTDPPSETEPPPDTEPPPTTEPPPEEPPPGSGPGVEQWRSTVEAYFPAERVEEALRVMDCESNGDSSAYNPYSGASGLYQFIPSTWASTSPQAGFGGASVFNGEANIGSAAWLTNYYANQGQDPWTPWGCKP